MPTIGPRNALRGFDGNRLAGIDTSPANRLKTAAYVLQNLEQYAPRKAPERPEALELSDAALVEAARKLDRTGKVNNAEMEALRLYGSWRSAVFKIEAESAGNLIMLLSLLNLLEEQERPEATRIRDFLLARYNAPISGPPAPWATSQLAENWAARYAQQRDVLPLSLRSLSSAKSASIAPRTRPEIPQQEDDDATF